MKGVLCGAMCLLSFGLQSLEYAVQFENDRVCAAKATIMPNEEIGLHRDACPQIVIALKGGVITRLEADGTTTDVHFPTGVAVFRDVDPPDELHKSINRGSEPVELIIIQLKENSLITRDKSF
ncbi:MAG: hypothetical protein JSR39_06050 [Verrucomicrobia bacterium]|nr:hypothetical protein [Verrucomicrobiota bacterium]